MWGRPLSGMLVNEGRPWRGKKCVVDEWDGPLSGKPSQFELFHVSTTYKYEPVSHCYLMMNELNFSNSCIRQYYLSVFNSKLTKLGYWRENLFASCYVRVLYLLNQLFSFNSFKLSRLHLSHFLPFNKHWETWNNK